MVIRHAIGCCAVLMLGAVGLLLGGPCGAFCFFMFGLAVHVVDETSRSRSREADRIIEASSRRRGGAAVPKSDVSWSTILVGALVLVSLIGYARMRAKGYSDVRDLLGDVAGIVSAAK